MASLPIPAKTYFNDFAFDLIEYTVERNSIFISSYKGLKNTDENGKHIAFLINCDIQINDVLTSNGKSFIIRDTEIDTYEGNPEIIKAYY